jgi:hypothetical protein
MDITSNAHPQLWQHTHTNILMKNSKKQQVLSLLAYAVKATEWQKKKSY